MEELACISGIVSDFQVRSFVLLVSDPGLSVLIPFIHREGGVVIQVNSGQRLETEITLLKYVHKKYLSRMEVTLITKMYKKGLLRGILLKVDLQQSSSVWPS